MSTINNNSDNDNDNNDNRPADDHAKLAMTRFDHLKAAIKSGAVVAERIYGAACNAVNTDFNAYYRYQLKSRYL